MTTILEKNEKYRLSEETCSAIDGLIRDCLTTKNSWGLIQNDIMFALTFWSMLECGFLSLQNENRKTTGAHHEIFYNSPLPENWKHETRKVYEASFILPPYSEHPVRLVGLPADDILCINVLATNISPKSVSLRSMAIDSSGYVPRPEEKTISSKFSRLEEFHFKLRNAIIWPIRCSILTNKGIINGSLTGLSDEIKLNIIGNLQVKELLMLSQTCHDFNRVCNDQGLWKNIFHKTFPEICSCGNKLDECEDISDWKEIYKRTYLIMRQDYKPSQQSSSDSFHTPPDTIFGEFDFDID